MSCLHPRKHWIVRPHKTHKSLESVFCKLCGRFYGNRETEKFKAQKEYWKKQGKKS